MGSTQTMDLNPDFCLYYEQPKTVPVKCYTTNYRNTLIEIAEDCPVASGQEPPTKGDTKSVANHQYEMLMGNPYRFSSDEVLYSVFAIRKEIGVKDWDAERQTFFSKGQPCFRASPLTKRYGWGIHSDECGKVALFGAETEAYQRLVADDSVKKVKALRSKR